MESGYLIRSISIWLQCGTKIFNKKIFRCFIEIIFICVEVICLSLVTIPNKNQRRFGKIESEHFWLFVCKSITLRKTRLFPAGFLAFLVSEIWLRKLWDCCEGWAAVLISVVKTIFLWVIMSPLTRQLSSSCTDGVNTIQLIAIDQPIGTQPFDCQLYNRLLPQSTLVVN